MDRIEIPHEQIVPLEAIAPGIQGLRIAFVNVFALSHSNGSWTLIDCALPFTSGVIRSWAEKHFRLPPNAIVLSHGHFDHVSAAADLAGHWDVPIYAHQLEHPYLNGREQYPPPNAGAGGGMMSWLSPLLPRGPINVGERLRELPAGEQGDRAIAELPGWEILHTPGHTPGHVSFFRREGRTLLPADAFCTTKPESFFQAAISQNSELHGPPAYFTSDWNLARQSVQRLSTLEPMVIAPGHGRPISGANLPAALRELAVRFDDIAVPENREPSAA
jgi:glyoxylase-like metal-dependent hydrolase (beta-lactamase superfamily II)